MRCLNNHVDQMLKSTKPTSSEATDLEQDETDNGFDFTSFTDDHEHISLLETTTSSTHYPSRNC